MSDQGAGALCELWAAGRLFGLETRKIREVLGRCVVQRVPLAPVGIAGMVAYRGEVLATVSLTAMLGGILGTSDGAFGTSERCVVVLKGDADWKGDAEDFGLAVDAVGEVVEPGEGVEAVIRARLSAEDGRIGLRSFRVRGEVLLQLDAEQLKPAVLGKRLGWHGMGV